MENHAQIEVAVRRELGRDAKVFLKRACTELTLKFGDAQGWQLTEEHLALEQRIAPLFTDEVYSAQQSREIIREVQRSWVLWAYRKGDHTYKTYLESFDIFADYVVIPGDRGVTDLQFAVLQF